MSPSSQEGSLVLSSYSAERPLLLFTEFPPDFAGGGAVILRSLLSERPRQELVWVSPSRTSATTNVRFVQLRTGELSLGDGRSRLLDATLFARALAREVLQVAKAEGASGLWLVLHGTGVSVAAELVSQDSLPVHCTIHDDPAFGVALRSRRYLILVPWLERCLSRALARAASVDVISSGMQRRYERRYGLTNCSVVHRATPGPIEPSPPQSAAVGLRVGILGNVYSYPQLPVLARSVAAAARELGVRGVLTFVGRGMSSRLKDDLMGETKISIEDAGHVDEAAAIEILRRQFVLYLNYPFGWRDSVLRQTSFPTKLSTYLLAARPLLVHAPGDSTLAELGALKGYVLSWSSMRSEDGAKALVQAWRDPRMHGSLHEPAESLRLRYFEPRANRERLAKLLNGLGRPGGTQQRVSV